ncbi:hypothetical protein FRC08_002748 [Ceratobasidium sp. 394]|nr:hypothetical protein FRC08_002748 [Ceratobasidium sp. 394]
MAKARSGTLDGSAIGVTSEVEHEDAHDDHHDETRPIQQTDKPRAAIAAEYLAKGYTLSDQVLQKAIDMDKKQGISQRFLNYFRSLDSTIGQKLFGKPAPAEPAATENGKEAVGETSEAGAAANLGRHPTVSGKAQETVAGIREKAMAMNEQGGYTAKANDVRSFSVHPRPVDLTCMISCSIIPRRSNHLLVKRCTRFTLLRRNRSWTSTKRRSELLQTRKRAPRRLLRPLNLPHNIVESNTCFISVMR